MTNVMTVVVHSPENADTHYRITILDDRGNPVNSVVLLDDAGRLEIRVPDVHSAKNYYVQIQDADPTLAQPVDFDVDIDFAMDATHLQPFVRQSLGKDQADYAVTLRVLQSQEFHFVLSATDWSAPVETGVRMMIYDAGGRVVFTTSVADGASRTADVFLNAGQYTVRFTRANQQEGTLQPILFELSGLTESEPIGPQLRDTTLGPVESASSPTAPPVTFFWLPYTPIDLAAQGMPSLVPTDPVSVIAEASPVGAGASFSLTLSGSQDLTPLISRVDVVGMFIAQTPTVFATSLTGVYPTGALNPTFYRASPVARWGGSYGEGILGVSEQAVAESLAGSRQALVSSLILEVRPGGLPVTLEPFREGISSRQSASVDVAGRSAVAEPADICDEVEISPEAESFTAASTPTSDHTLLGYLFRIGALQGLLLTLLFLHMRGLGIDIPRFARAASRSIVGRNHPSRRKYPEP
jgi:hypothetical protein